MLNVVDIRDMLSMNHVHAVARVASVLGQNRAAGAVFLEGHGLSPALFEQPTARSIRLQDLFLGDAMSPCAADGGQRQLQHLCTALLPGLARALFATPSEARGWMIEQCRSQGRLGRLSPRPSQGGNGGLMTLALLPAGGSVSLVLDGNLRRIDAVGRDRVVLVFGAQLARMFLGFGAGRLSPCETHSDAAADIVLTYSFGSEEMCARGVDFRYAALSPAPRNIKVQNGHTV